MTTPSTESARALRAGFRELERSHAQRRLLTAAATALSKEKNAAALRTLLAQVTAFAAADIGSLLAYESGALNVIASIGPSPPPGTNLPVAGAFAPVLRKLAPPVFRSNVDSKLRMERERSVGFEALFPLPFAGEVCGVLALVCVRGKLELDADDTATIEAVAGLMATALQLRSARTSPQRQRASSDKALAALTPRERQVFALLPRGLTNAVMAEELGIAAGTVKVHVERILAKLNLRDRTQAAVLAAKHGYAP
jgi:RNA polymerase sigma factor (sigma-70 family)